MTPIDAVALPSPAQMLLGLYAYLLPLLLYVVWSALAFWDLGRRDRIGGVQLWMWAAIIFLVPVLGALAYLLVGGGQVSRQLKLSAVGGGAFVYLVVLWLGFMHGGIA
jgi:Phospholipase_D-nuclease N-terminal